MKKGLSKASILLVFRMVIFMILVVLSGFFLFHVPLSEYFTTIPEMKQSAPEEDRAVSVAMTDIQGKPLEPVKKSPYNVSRYDPYDYNIKYHEENNIGEFYDSVEMKEIQVLNKDGKLVNLPYAPSQNLPVYYDIEKYPYGVSKPLPTYRQINNG